MTQHKLFATGLNEPEVKPSTPSESDKSSQVAEIIQAMEWSRNHSDGVTTARMIEICGPGSYRQRISDARKYFRARGLDIICRKAARWNNYYLGPYEEPK